MHYSSLFQCSYHSSYRTTYGPYSSCNFLHVSTYIFINTVCAYIHPMLEMERYIDVSSTQKSDTGIDTIFNISKYCASQYIKCIDINITYIYCICYTIFICRCQFSIAVESEKRRFLSVYLKKIRDICTAL